MAGCIKLLTKSVLKPSSLNFKRISKLCRAISSFPDGALFHRRNTECLLYEKKLSSIIYAKRNYSQTTKIVPFNLSDIGEGIKEVTIKEWFVKVGDKVSQFDNICEVQSDKASVTITSRYDGIITKLYYDIDDTAPVGQPLVDLKISGDSVGAEEPPQNTKTVENARTLDTTKVLATPAVRRIAAEHKINLLMMSGTGRNGRVLKEDLLMHLEQEAQKGSSVKECVRPTSKPKVTTPVNTEMIRGVQKVMARTMTSANTIPHLLYCDEIYLDELVNCCSKLKTLSKEVKITYMPFFIKAVSHALKKFPILNSSVDELCDKIIYKPYHNIGIAMDTKSGLLVPNIKNVQNMDIVEIARELNRLHKMGLEGTLSPSDLNGGTATLSNIGSIGGTYTKPIILPPEVLIGGIGKIQLVPRYNEKEELIKRSIMCVSWAADHRIIDGATVAKFSNTWKFYLENPILLMVNL